MEEKPGMETDHVKIGDNFLIRTEAGRRAKGGKPNPTAVEMMKEAYKDDPEGFLDNLINASSELQPEE